MSRRARLVVAAAVALVSLFGIGVLGVRLATRGSGRAKVPTGWRERAADAPFAGFRETALDVNGRCRRVAVADTASLREQGLRAHADLGAYAGMLFVSNHDDDTAFTMAGVTKPLEISWFTATGARVGRAHLAPCPHRAQADCPQYLSPLPYRLALETPGGSPAGSRIAPCS